MLIHRPLGSDERYKPARAYLIQCAGKKVIVDQEMVLVIPLVVEGIAAERDVADSKVEKAVRQFGILKALHRDTVLLVKLWAIRPVMESSSTPNSLLSFMLSGTSPKKLPIPQDGSNTLPVRKLMFSTA